MVNELRIAQRAQQVILLARVSGECVSSLRCV